MTEDLVEDLLSGDHRALARTITKIENREPGYRDLVARLHEHTGDAAVVGITGSPGAGKSTLVDKLAEAYRDRGLTVGIIAIDPSSPYTGGAVLGDRIRMAATEGDMDVFVRSMSTRGTLGGLSTATADAVKALDAFGKDRIVIETVGAGQNEVDVVRTADTVAVLVPPGSGDDVQMLKAGILEIADLFVVNKADRSGADRVVRELREMLEYRQEDVSASAGHHGTDAGTGPGGVRDDGRDDGRDGDADTGDGADWEPPILETVAETGEGVPEFVETLEDHGEYLARSGELDARRRARWAAEIRTLIQADLSDVLAAELERRGGIEAAVDRVATREHDPYGIADEIVGPLRDCVERRGQDDE